MNVAHVEVVKNIKSAVECIYKGNDIGPVPTVTTVTMKTPRERSSFSGCYFYKVYAKIMILDLKKI